MPARVVVRCVFFAGDQLLRVIELTVFPGADFVCKFWQVACFRSCNRNIFSYKDKAMLLLLLNIKVELANRLFLPMTVASRSTITTLGTILPRSASEKKVLKQESDWVGADGKVPSGRIPCSRQYSCQQAAPICTPAWPTWMDMHSLCSRLNRPHVILYSFRDLTVTGSGCQNKEKTSGTRKKLFRTFR